MLEHVVEREQAAHEHRLGSGAAVADVFGAERPVELPAEDPAHSADAHDAGHGLFGGRALRDQGVDEAARLFGMRIQKPGPLGADKHAAVETCEGDPFGPASRPPEGLERRFPSPQMGDHLGGSVTRARSAWR